MFGRIDCVALLSRKEATFEDVVHAHARVATWADLWQPRAVQSQYACMAFAMPHATA